MKPRPRTLLQRLKVGKPPPWGATTDGLRRRDFRSYDHYVEYQRSKLGTLDLHLYEREFRGTLRARIGDQRGRSVLCLAARLGAEVRAFADAGAFAVGIDLNPGKDNPRVLVGDFHELQFADHCVDVVYTNSLDHALDLGTLCNEVLRVLKPEGRFLVDAMPGNADEPERFGRWEVTSWEYLDDLVHALTSVGFTLESQSPFDHPWPGSHLVLTPLPPS